MTMVLTFCLLLWASLAFGAGARITWTVHDPNQLIEYFLIYRSVTGNAIDYALIATTAKETREYVDPDLVVGVTYFYEVKACNSGNYGGCSTDNPRQWITMPPITTPTMPANIQIQGGMP